MGQRQQPRAGWRIDGTEFGNPAPAIYVGYNGWSRDVNFILPSPGAGKSWYRVTDTATWAEGANQAAVPGSETLLGGQGATTCCAVAACCCSSPADPKGGAPPSNWERRARLRVNPRNSRRTASGQGECGHGLNLDEQVRVG
ncbi:hypothetical protein [Micromonospora reichwaldensis]|uniref:hypothetical protein n=1 Tax=Micromonospora reichwaldensis TaxID=3075516 RepID=UPI0037C621AD